MKKLALVLLALALSPFVQAEKFTEGTHYTVISAKAPTKQPEVVEFFSYLCPACYRFEPLVESLKPKLGADVTFKKNHVEFLGADLGKALTQASAIAQLLKVEDKVNPAIFNAIHQERRRMTGIDDLRTIFLDHGVDAKKFDGAATSFMVRGNLSKMAHNTKKFNIRGVPTFIINGKYQVNNKAISSAALFEELVIYLTNKKD